MSKIPFSILEFLLDGDYNKHKKNLKQYLVK